MLISEFQNSILLSWNNYVSVEYESIFLITNSIRNLVSFIFMKYLEQMGYREVREVRAFASWR